MMHKGFFTIKQYRAGKLLKTVRSKNGITNEGAALVLDGIFNGGAIPANFYIGLIDTTGFTSFSISDTMSSHSGWTEFTDYSGNRKAYNTDPTANRSIKNSSSPAFFSFNSLAIIEAIFITTDETKGGSAGTLLATSLLGNDGDGGSLNLVVGDEITVEYEILY